jgi:hypothetical protein
MAIAVLGRLFPARSGEPAPAVRCFSIVLAVHDEIGTIGRRVQELLLLIDESDRPTAQLESCRRFLMDA